jgi:hypothetical protein
MPNFLHQVQRQNKQQESVTSLNHLKHNLAKCKCVELFHKNFFNNFSNQYFKLGYVLLICASGGIKFESLSIFFEEFSNTNNTSFLKNKCCLYHLLVSIEEDEERKIKSKLKISNFINNKIFSENFLDFLCQSLSFSQKPNHNFLITNHPWIKITNYIHMNNNFNKVRVIMKEVIKISREFKRSQLKQNNYNEAKLNNFLNNFEIILSNNKLIKKDELILAIETKKDVIKDLTFELGINSKDLIAQLQEKVSYDLKIN